MYKKLCIFDLDGTLNLKDYKLSAEILKLSRMGVDFIVSTGRSNSYVIKTFIKNNIIPPRYIIADNGGSIYDTLRKVYLRKTPLPTDKRKALVSEFFRLGGQAEDIRYSDGSNLYVVDDELVRSYYANDSAIYHKKEDIVDELLRDDVDVIKITLAAKRKLIETLIRFVEENGIPCYTDSGNTAFPIKERMNFRLDLTDTQMSKGEGVKFLVEHLGVTKFLCIGNGLNDFSMFKYAIETGNRVLIVRNYEDGKMLRESEELVEKTIAYAKQKGKPESLIFTTYPANGRVGSMEEKNYNRQRGAHIYFSKVRGIDDRQSKTAESVKRQRIMARIRRKRDEREH